MGITLQALAARRDTDLFVPLIFRLALRLEQVSWEDALEDAPLVAFALGSAQRMFRTDACVNWFDTGLEAEAAGAARGSPGGVSVQPAAPADLPDPGAFVAAPAIAHVLAVTRQLCETNGERACVLGCLTGPATLLTRLFGAPGAKKLAAALDAGGLPESERRRLDRAASLSVALARAYCELGVGGLALLEDAVPQSPGLAGAFDALFNLASYYGVPIVVVSRASLPPEVGDAYAQLGTGYVVAPGTQGSRVVAVAPESLSGGEEALCRPIGAGRLVATTWEVPADAAPECVADFGARLKR
jgi:hypothetical protein